MTSPGRFLSGPLRWIVDGMNVIGSRPDGWWRDRPGAQRRLVERLSTQPGRPEGVLVVFDGDPPAGTSKGLLDPGQGAVEVRFAGRGRNAADDVIVGLVRDHPRPGELVVVTSDRDLAERVQQLGATRRPASEVELWDDDPYRPGGRRP